MNSLTNIGMDKIRKHFLKQSIFGGVWLLIITVTLSVCIEGIDEVFFKLNRPLLFQGEPLLALLATILVAIYFCFICYAFYLLVKCASGNENTLVNLLTNRGSLEYAIVSSMEENLGLTTITCLTIPSVTKRGKLQLIYRTNRPLNLTLGDKVIALVFEENLSCLL